MAGRPPNENLAQAKMLGDKTYEGSVHAQCGTTTRYTSGGGCVACARAKQIAMRQALLARQAEEQGVGQTHAEALNEPTHQPPSPDEINREESFELDFEEIAERDLTADDGPAYKEPWE